MTLISNKGSILRRILDLEYFLVPIFLIGLINCPQNIKKVRKLYFLSSHAFIFGICNHFWLPFTLIFGIINHWGFPLTTTWSTFTFWIRNQWSFEFTYNIYFIRYFLYSYYIPSISSSQSSGLTASGSGII